MPGRKRNERGLFGIVKKKSVLFTFSPRKGEEISSDSEDSDYFPGRQSTDEEDIDAAVQKERSRQAKNKVKRKISQSPTGKNKRLRSKYDSTTSSNGYKDVIARLPPEILLKVFIFAAQAEGITIFLPKVSRVCKEWHSVASDPLLLKHLDLSVRGEGGYNYGATRKAISLTKQRIDQLLSVRDLSHCQELSLAGQANLNIGNIKAMLTQTPQLKCLDIRGCHTNSETLKKLPELCPNLQRIDLSQLSTASSIMTCGPLEGLVKVFGPQLVELRLAYMSVLERSTKALLISISQSCPLLQELDLSLAPVLGMGSLFTMDMGLLAAGCPKLTELRLNRHTVLDEIGEPYNPPFSKLRVYSQTSQTDVDQYQGRKPAFYRMFSGNDLVELNISGTKLLPSLLKDSQITRVKRLFVKDMHWTNNDSEEISVCMSRWSESIEVLDFSDNKMCQVATFLDFFTLQMSPETALKILNLSNSTVNSRTVTSILKNCHALEAIDLTSCRELPRGCKRSFARKEFKGLLNSLKVDN